MSSQPQPATARLLIIDDNQTIHDAFDGIFAPDVSTSKLEAAEAVLYGLDSKPSRLKPHYEVDHALSGLDGVEKTRAALAASRPYQLAFVDVRMPGIDGIETIQRIWQLDSQIQTVICTAYSDYRWEQLAERLGQTDRLLVLKKPFHDVEVMQMASAMVEKWYLARQAALKTEQMELLVARRTQKLLALQNQETPPIAASTSVELPASGEEGELERDQPLLLCIGDREASLGVLVQPLGDVFRIILKSIGSGWQEARESVPDFILIQPTDSDPKAFELCRQIKDDELAGHIPIIMLLPDSVERTQLRALEVGVDDCILPPCRLPMLRARMDNLLASRRKLQEYFRQARTFQPQELATNHADAQFLRRVVDVVQANLSDYEFDVETLARKLSVSRRQLFRKFKAIANTTPNAFIRDIRLKRAAHLLHDSNLTVSEIIYMVGFSDPKYFRTVFKEQFGVLPGEFTKQS
ncbi:MAG: helix-turn-helix domain-containing protein [Verrucomicrobiota bacterium]